MRASPKALPLYLLTYVLLLSACATQKQVWQKTVSATNNLVPNWSFESAYASVEEEYSMEIKDTVYRVPAEQFLPPPGWIDCGFEGQTPPDVLSEHRGRYGFRKKGVHGSQYAALVCRADGTFEAMCTRLLRPLQPDTLHSLTFSLAQNAVFSSLLRRDTSGRLHDFSDPLIFKVWLGNGPCEKEKLLFEKGPLNHEVWREYQVAFRPTQRWSYLFLEVDYLPERPAPYNGHVLVDAIRLN